jgi:PAS domain S-box-containing protein
MKLYLNRKVLIGFSLSIIVILCLGFASYAYIRNVIETGHRGTGNQQIFLESERMRSLASELNAAELKYILTGKEQFLHSFSRHLSKIQLTLNTMSILGRDYPALIEKIKALKNVIEKKKDRHKTIQPIQRPERILDQSLQESFMADINAIIDEIQSEELRLKKEQQLMITKQFYQFAATFFGLLIAGLITPAVLAYSLNNNLRERAKAEQKLTQAASAIHDLYEKAPCGYFTIDKEGMFSNINETLLNWLGYKHHETVDRLHVDEIFPGASVVFKKTLETDELSVKDIEFEMVSKDLSKTSVIVNAVIVRSKNGKDVSTRCSVFDNTERKKAEEESKLLQKELESFSYSVSHDLRAPLRSISGYVEILNEDYGGQLEPAAKVHLNTVSSNAKKMGQLIDDLLHFSKTGRKEIVKTETNMDEVVKDVLSELVEQEKNEKIKIDLQQLGSSSADINLIRQVWINLISNALKYSRKKDQPQVIIGSTDEATEKIYYVKDNGAGFDMKYVDKLFGVFQRLHKQDEFEGTGVGLALVKRIVEKHNGKIWVKAGVNEGASFYFSLPK